MITLQHNVGDSVLSLCLLVCCVWADMLLHLFPLAFTQAGEMVPTVYNERCIVCRLLLYYVHSVCFCAQLFNATVRITVYMVQYVLCGSNNFFFQCYTPITVEGVTGMEEVAEMWMGHFSAVLNCLNNERVHVASYNLAYDAEENCIVSATEIERCIAKLKNGKSNGMDNVSSEHLKNCNPRLVSMLALCFTKMFSHGYLPANMLSVQLVPIIKSKSGLISSKDNYRPIAIASVLSKVLEFIILERIEMFVYTHENQFGFKKQHGTDTCIYVMKEIINRYQRLGSSVHLSFLDASKAFDRINHDTLFKKLVNRNVPAYIVRLLVFWYSHQQMFVKWGNVMSSVFTVSNGVRQGGVLSPYLFNVYMDGLS